LTGETSPLRILLVEDDDAQADFVIEAFEGAERACITRTVRLQEALQQLATTQVDVVLLDLTLPDAFDLLGVKAIRLASPDVPLIVLTGATDPTLGSRVMAAGADDYLQKDQIDAHLLVRSIRYARERHAYLEGARRLVTFAELNEKLEQRVAERTAKLEASEVALQVAARNKDEFLATLAHELRNPLVPLRTGLDLLLQTQPTSPGVGSTLAAMNRQLDHMVRLIDDLLDVARISHKTLELKKERADIAAIIETAIDTCRPFFDKRRQSISVDVHRSMFAFVDPTRVSQILGNLLHNAAKYTPEGGEVRVELAHESGNAIVRIIDYGMGIPAELIVRIFDMFVHVDHLQPDAGLGIGLALARQLAELHEGTLVASSSGAGRGSTFTLSLPVAEEPQQKVSHDRQRPERRPDVAMLNIVVVEDNDDSADLLAMWLESHGHKVGVARTGSDGLELVKATRPDVVLCDIGLPGMDGVEVCRSVRALSIDFNPVMVAMSGWGREQDRQRTGEAGFDHHLLKPVAMDKLHALLQSVVLAPRDIEPTSTSSELRVSTTLASGVRTADTGSTCT
jgi:signal transduction histidine kinase